MNLQIKRLDHHGIVADVIDDLKIVPLIEQYLPQDDKQEITPGEAVKGMIMNGLGFANRPLFLSPQFFTNLPLEHLFRGGVKASHFNRHKLGIREDKAGYIEAKELPILERLNIAPENWLSLTKDLTRLFHGAIGEPQTITNYCEQINSKRRTNLSQSQRYLA